MKHIFFRAPVALSLLFAFLVQFFPAFSQDSPVLEKIVQTGQSDNRVMEHLDVLSNRFGGRLIGSDARGI